MQFESNSSVRVAVAIVAGGMAFTTMSMMLVAEGGGFGFLMFMTLTMVFVAVGAWKFRSVVDIDRKAGYLDREFGTIGFRESERRKLSEFSSVGIVMGGGGSNRAKTVYNVELVGHKNIKLPGGGTNLNLIKKDARRVASYLDLPLDDEPTIGVFGFRF